MEINYFIAEKKHFKELALLRFIFKAENEKIDSIFILDYIKYLERETKLSRIKVFCAESENKIIGNINLIIIPKSPKPESNNTNIGYITNTFVLHEYRGYGIGSKLLEMIYLYSKEKNVELLFVWPSETSINYYCKAGFQDQNEILEKIIHL